MNKIIPDSYKITHNLKDDVKLEMYVFNHDEHRWIFTYNYFYEVQKAESKTPISVVNDITLVVNYNKRVITDNLNLRMHIVRPDKKGQRFWLGIDVSEGSELNAEFKYEKKGDLFEMKLADFGNYGRVDIDYLGEGLVNQNKNIPFPIEDTIKKEFTDYKVPFLTNENKLAFFEFPEKYDLL